MCWSHRQASRIVYETAPRAARKYTTSRVWKVWGAGWTIFMMYIVKVVFDNRCRAEYTLRTIFKLHNDDDSSREVEGPALRSLGNPAQRATGANSGRHRSGR